ncbi:conserved hypothetical protein [Methanocella paludicola SANAE]|uniref:Zinc ribbon domain-containing protein n=1 Tax=Methanocella paludicola (strain DSM 17711 / JCM 13418 / NBRC 101707 / SANAE) TaxID=304371 RepID=D1Z285_METPS|nr:hypothetical protein [Methanocella paludicola]BAI62807.1 conserved hypothetical protein [Methanocella paludicola SANAE]
MAEIKCTKCGAPIGFEPGDRFVKCGYCDTQLYIDRSGAGFFYIMPYFLDRSGAEGTFKRWAAAPERAKDLDRLAQVTNIRQQYFPVYLFKRTVNGQEKVMLEPARSTTLPGLHSLKVPAGDIKVFDQNYKVDVELLKPDMDMTAYLPRLPGEPKEQALVYFPIWAVSYKFSGRDYDAVIDGSSGEVFAADYPGRSSAPYFALAAAAFIVFFIEGFLTLLAGCGLLAAVVTLPVVFVAAYTIVRRF